MSLGLYLVGSIVLNNVAVALFLHLVQSRGLSSAGAISVAAAVSLVVTPLLTELFYRFVEVPTGWAGNRLWAWIRD